MAPAVAASAATPPPGPRRRTPNDDELKDWLPITASRNAKWWYSSFHNVTAIIGAGVLSFPHAMAYQGWGLGVTLLVLSWVITLFTLWQLVQMHEMVPGKRFDRYHELAQYAFGEKLGLWILVPQQLLIEVGVDIVYMIVGGQSLMIFYRIVCHNCSHIGQPYWILVFASINFVLAQLPNFNSIAGVSFVAAVMSLCYSTIAWILALKNRNTPADYSRPTKHFIHGFLSSFGQVAFAFSAHNLVLEIQATIPSTQEKPSTGPMWQGVVLAYIIVALCYFPVAFVGYWALGNAVQDDIFFSFSHPRWLIAVANMMVVIHVIGGFQIYAMPVYDMMETITVKRLKFNKSFLLRFIIRSVYVAFTCFVAIAMPFFSALLSFFGGIAYSPTTYFVPCIIWLKLKNPKMFSWSWTINWACIILGVLLMTASTIGGILSIRDNASIYHFFSQDSTNSKI